MPLWPPRAASVAWPPKEGALAPAACGAGAASDMPRSAKVEMMMAANCIVAIGLVGLVLCVGVCVGCLMCIESAVLDYQLLRIICGKRIGL